MTKYNFQKILNTPSSMYAHFCVLYVVSQVFAQLFPFSFCTVYTHTCLYFQNKYLNFI